MRRIFTTEALQNGLPPHICQLILGHKNLNTTMGYNTVYPEKVITGHRAFLARRRQLRPAEEYRTPTEAEWEEFLGHFERRKVALGDCGRAYGTGCVHEMACERCSLLRVDPAQRPRLVIILDSLAHGSPRPGNRAGSASSKAFRSPSRRSGGNCKHWTRGPPASPR